MQEIQIPLADIENKLIKIQPFLDLGLLSDRIYLGGGSVQTIWNPKGRIRDYDVFFTNIDDFAPTKAKVESFGFKLLDHHPESALFNYKGRIKGEEVIIQLILYKVYNGPYGINHDSDLRCCCGVLNQDTLFTFQEAIEDNKVPILHINTVLYPATCLNRIMKYHVEKGYHLGDVYKEYAEFVQGKTFKRVTNKTYLPTDFQE